MKTWTKTWPTEPGQYLLYGYYITFGGASKPILGICRVYLGSKQRPMYICDGNFVYPSEFFGVFTPFECELPDLKDFE